MTDSSIAYRPVTEADLPFIQSVYASSREAEMALVDWTDSEKNAFLTMQCDAQLYHYQAHYPGAEHVIILIDGEPAGRLYTCRGSEELRLMDITLLPRFRNQGAGSRIMRALMQECDQANLSITLNVEVINPGAFRLYHRLGFEVVSQQGVHMFMRRLPGGTPTPSKEGPWPSHSSQKSAS